MESIIKFVAEVCGVTLLVALTLYVTFLVGLSIKEGMEE